MTQKTINCAECGVEVTYDEKDGYPRKYCFNCSAKKKQQWAGKSADVSVPDGETAPVEKINVFVKTDKGYEEVKPKPEFDDPLEYQIRSREVRCRALEASQRHWKQNGGDHTAGDVIRLANYFVEWIYGN